VILPTPLVIGMLAMIFWPWLLIGIDEGKILDLIIQFRVLAKLA
jgi:hypothetical protein